MSSRSAFQSDDPNTLTTNGFTSSSSSSSLTEAWPEVPQTSCSEQTYPLAVIQWKINGHPRRTEHWSLVALKSKQSAYVYMLAGNYDSFTYDWSFVEEFFRPLADDNMRGGCLVGAIPVSGPGSPEWLGQKLQEVRVVRQDPSFDGQNWVMEAIWMLKGLEEVKGIILPDINERKIRDEMTQEKERWEEADDTLIERLFP